MYYLGKKNKFRPKNHLHCRGINPEQKEAQRSDSMHMHFDHTFFKFDQSELYCLIYLKVDAFFSDVKFPTPRIE